MPFDTEFLRLFFGLQAGASELLQVHSRDVVSPTQAQFKLALQKILNEMSAKAQQQVRSNVLFFPIRINFHLTDRLPSRCMKPYLREAVKLIKELTQKSRESCIRVEDADHGADASHSCSRASQSTFSDSRWSRVQQRCSLRLQSLALPCTRNCPRLRLVTCRCSGSSHLVKWGSTVSICESLLSASFENRRSYSSELYKCASLFAPRRSHGEGADTRICTEV